MRASSVRQSVDNEAAQDAGPECRDALAGTEKDKLAPLGQSHRGSIRLPGDVPDSSKLLAGACDCLLQSVGREAPPPIFWMRPRTYSQVAAAHERVTEKRRKNAATLDHAITLFDEQDAIIPVLEYPQIGETARMPRNGYRGESGGKSFCQEGCHTSTPSDSDNWLFGSGCSTQSFTYKWKRMR